MKRLFMLTALVLAVASSLPAQQPARMGAVPVRAKPAPQTRRPAVTADFGATVSNIFGSIRWEWGDGPGLFSGEAFRSKRHDAFDTAKNMLAVVVSGPNAATGFVLREGNRTWLYTNAHVVRDRPVVRATMLDGTTLAAEEDGALIVSCDGKYYRSISDFIAGGTVDDMKLFRVADRIKSVSQVIT